MSLNVTNNMIAQNVCQRLAGYSIDYDDILRDVDSTFSGDSRQCSVAEFDDIVNNVVLSYLQEEY